MIDLGYKAIIETYEGEMYGTYCTLYVLHTFHKDSEINPLKYMKYKGKRFKWIMINTERINYIVDHCVLKARRIIKPGGKDVRKNTERIKRSMNNKASLRLKDNVNRTMSHKAYLSLKEKLINFCRSGDKKSAKKLMNWVNSKGYSKEYDMLLLNYEV